MNLMKGKYYNIIIYLIKDVKYLYAGNIEHIYKSIPCYCEEEHIIDNAEFVFSMRYALADVFGSGCEVEEPEGLFDFLNF
jgi:hypothetical protein